MELEIIGYDENNEPIYQENLTEEEVGERLRETPEDKAFLEKYSLDDPLNSALFKVAVKRLGEDYTLADAQGLLKTIVQAGGFITIHEDVQVEGFLLHPGQYEFTPVALVSEPEQQPEPEVPAVDSRGHLLGASQKAWSEYRQFAESHSSQDCRERAKVDAGFASFVRKNFEREMNQGVGDAVENLNARSQEPTTASLELRAWVAEYNRTSAEQVRKLRRADFNPLGYTQYNKNLDAAIAAGLI
jgi:hypothetical protein